MARRQSRDFECDVVSETVHIQLRSRRVGGFAGRDAPFVQCNQSDCQYVEKNELPCPLTAALFPNLNEDKIVERDEDF